MRFAIFDNTGVIRQINEGPAIPNLPEGLFAWECGEEITFNHVYNIGTKEWILTPSPIQPNFVQSPEIPQNEFNQLLMQQIIDLQIKIDMLGV